MDYEKSIAAAIEAIGPAEGDDYVIAPLRHAEQLAAAAPAFAATLRRSETHALARTYEEKDAEALRTGLIFKRTTARANWAVLLTACFSAMLLTIPPLMRLWAGVGGKWLEILLGLCGVLSGAVASMYLFRIREGRLAERWMTARAGAEARRLAYFELVTSSTEDGETGAIPLPLLQLQYFCRYQLNTQMAYYRRRGGDHERAADRLLALSAAAVAVASFAAGAGGLLGGAWLAIAGLGVGATALSAFSSAREAANQDRRNGAQYRKTREILDDLASRLDQVRMAAAAGATEPLRQYVAAVHEPLAAEHREWLESRAATEASVARLEEALAKLREQQPRASGGTAAVGEGQR